MILHGGERRDRLGAVRLITVSDRIGRNYRMGPYFSIFVFVLSSFFFFSSFFLSFYVFIIMYWKNPGRFGPIPVRSGRFGFKGGSFRPEFRVKSFRPGVFI